MTATLRLKSGAIESDNYLADGAGWNFNVTAGGIKYSFYAVWPSSVSVKPRVVYGGLTALLEKAPLFIGSSCSPRSAWESKASPPDTYIHPE